MGKVIGNPTTTPININNFVGKASSINNKVSGESIHITDSSENKFNNLVIYGKTTQAAEPTLDAPQELVSVGAEPFNVYVCGNNLFNPYAVSCVNLVYENDVKPNDKNISKYNVYGLKIESTTYDNNEGLIITQGEPDEGKNMINGCVNLYFDNPALYKFGEKYTFIADYEVKEDKLPDNNLRVNIKGATIPNNFFNLPNTKGKICTLVTASQSEKYPNRRCIEFYTLGKSITLKNIMWLPGDWRSNPPEYEDYKEQVLNVEAKTTLGNADNRAGVVGIPVKSGGNYTDESGQSWIANTIDFKDGKHYRRVWARLLPALRWTMSYMTDDGDYIFYRETDWSFGEHLEVLCNYFPNKIMPTEGHGIWISKNENGNAVIYIKASFVSPSELEEFITTNRPYIYYAHSSATATTLKAEELEQYKSLASYYPTTRVISAVDAGMEVEYVADTKNYIDNKFAELTALVLEG